MPIYLDQARVVVSEPFEPFQMLEILLTADSMKGTWETFDRRIPTSKWWPAKPRKVHEYAAFDFMHFLLCECRDALSNWEEMNSSGLRSPSAHKIYYSKVGKLARQLKETIENDFKLSVAFGKRNAEITNFINWDMVRDTLGEEKINNEIVGMARRYSPTVCDLLTKIEDFAEKTRNAGTPSARPNNSNSKAIYLIRRLSNFFREHTQEPWHEAVASIVSTLLNDDSIDAVYVQKTARSEVS